MAVSGQDIRNDMSDKMRNNPLPGFRYTGRFIVAGLLFFLITGDGLWGEKAPAPGLVSAERAKAFSPPSDSAGQTEVWPPEIDGRRVLHF